MGDNSRWMQTASKRMKKKGTVGSFTRWCKQHGYGGVNSRCIQAGLNAGGKIAKKAAFAKAARKARHAMGGEIGDDEYGLGGWIKDNWQGVMGGLKTAAGIGLSFTGLGAGIGVPLATSGVSDIAGELSGDVQAKRQEDLLSQQTAATDAAQQQLLTNNYLSQVGGSSNPYLPTFAIGGKMYASAEVEDDEILQRPSGKMKKMSGKRHEQGGIDVNEPVGTKVFSDREIYKATGRTFAEEADIIRKRIAQLDNMLT